MDSSLWLRFLRLLRQKLIFIHKSSHFQVGGAVSNDDVVTYFHLLGEVGVFDTDEVFVAFHLLLAIEVVLLALLELDRLQSFFEITESDTGTLKIDIDTASPLGHCCCISDHLNEDFVLFVSDLSHVDPADVHTALQHRADGIEVVGVDT